MSLTLVDPATNPNVAQQILGGVSADVAIIAELLRAEVTARGHCTRSMAMRRALRTMAPAGAPAPEAVEEVCSLLERAGDFQEAPGGVLFATPLRAIDIGDGEWRVVGSTPLTWLRAKLTCDWKSEGIARTCRIEPAADRVWRSDVVAVGGVVISPETWAGFGRTPKADAAWLAALDARLNVNPEAAGSLERDGPLAWSGLIAAEGQLRWLFADRGPQARLWRARNQWGYWKHAWTTGGSPTSQPFHQLRNDESARTLFAVALSAGTPVTVKASHRGDVSIVDTGHWLPSAEYRFLSVQAVADREKHNRWTISRTRVQAVLDALRDRLGVIVQETSAA
jgi:hypothetical protein